MAMFEVIERVLVTVIVEQPPGTAKLIVSPLSPSAVEMASGNEPVPEEAQLVTVSVVAACAAAGKRHTPAAIIRLEINTETADRGAARRSAVEVRPTSGRIRVRRLIAISYQPAGPITPSR
jgi:hypothetical protein